MDNYDKRLDDFIHHSLANSLEIKAEDVVGREGYSIRNYSLKVSCIVERNKEWNGFFEILKNDIEKRLNNENDKKEEGAEIS